MSGTDYLLDTNILIQISQGDQEIASFLDNKGIYISFISEMELLSKRNLTKDQLKAIQVLIDDCIVIDLNQAIKVEAIRIRRETKLKLPDAIIAATAKYLRLPFLTADSDFEGFDEIEIIQIKN